MRKIEIDSSHDIIDLLKYIFECKGESFDPALDISKLTNTNGELAFSKEEGKYLEDLMNESFRFCVFNKIDIYLLAKTAFDFCKIKAAA